MFGSIRLGTILGIPVGMNWSVLVIAWLIAFSLAVQVLPVQVPGLADAAYWIAGLATAALFFLSLLAHELSHAVVARREGLTVSGITLWLLGGVARMNGEAPTPGAEARIAGVGPLTSLLLALVFGSLALLVGLAPAGELTSLAAAATGWLSLVNLVLAVFNLLPGAPLDGGRLARATIWRWRRDKRQATRWSTGLGQLLGYGLVGIGIFRFAVGDIGGLWFVLLGFFLSSAAAAERRSSEVTEDLRDTRVAEIMTRDPLRIPATLTVDTFVSAALGESRSSAWLLTGPAGSVTAMLDVDQLRSVRGRDRLSRRVGEVATRIEDAPVAYGDELVVEWLSRLEGGAQRAVVRQRGADETDVIGVLTPEDISRAIQLSQLRGREGGRPSSAPGRPRNPGRVLP